MRTVAEPQQLPNYVKDQENSYQVVLDGEEIWQLFVSDVVAVSGSEKRVSLGVDVDVKVVVGVENFGAVLSADLLHASQHHDDLGATQLSVAIGVENFEAN